MSHPPRRNHFEDVLFAKHESLPTAATHFFFDFSQTTILQSQARPRRRQVTGSLVRTLSIMDCCFAARMRSSKRIYYENRMVICASGLLAKDPSDYGVLQVVGFASVLMYRDGNSTVGVRRVR